MPHLKIRGANVLSVAQMQGRQGVGHALSPPLQKVHVCLRCQHHSLCLLPQIMVGITSDVYSCSLSCCTLLSNKTTARPNSNSATPHFWGSNEALPPLFALLTSFVLRVCHHHIIKLDLFIYQMYISSLHAKIGSSKWMGSKAPCFSAWWDLQLATRKQAFSVVPFTYLEFIYS